MFHTGDQLELDLFQGVPWDGRSPRGLTKVSGRLFLRRKPPRHEVRLDAVQLEIWPNQFSHTEKRGPQPKAGAPSLLEHLLKGVPNG